LAHLFGHTVQWNPIQPLMISANLANPR
jgi:hypothetical protein